MATAPVPQMITSMYAVAIASVALFGIAFLISLIYGIAMAIIYRDLDFTERVSLALTVLFPGIKYTFLRERTDWSEFNASTKLMVLFDLINTVLYAAVFAMYVYLLSTGLFLLGVEIACFFFVLANYLAYLGITGRNFRTFWRLQDLIRESQMVF